MPGKDKAALRENSPYNAAITREQFLFYEMRTTAKLVCEGLSKEEIIETICPQDGICMFAQAGCYERYGACPSNGLSAK